MKLIPTASQTAGPFLHLGLTDRRCVGRIAASTTVGERIQIVCRVLDGDGVPLSDGMIEVWQADAHGHYRHPEDVGVSPPDPAWHGFGRLALDENGCCTFWTVKPGRVPGSGNTLQAPHLNVAIFARGLLKHLVTRMYFGGEQANADDPVLALVPVNRRETLLARLDPSSTGKWVFELRLCGQDETVFFDV